MLSLHIDRRGLLALLESFSRQRQTLEDGKVGFRCIACADQSMRDPLAQQGQRSAAIDDGKRHGNRGGEGCEPGTLATAQEGRVDDRRPAGAERQVRHREQARIGLFGRRRVVDAAGHALARRLQRVQPEQALALDVGADPERARRLEKALEVKLLPEPGKPCVIASRAVAPFASAEASFR